MLEHEEGIHAYVIRGVPVTCGMGACPSCSCGHRLTFASGYLFSFQ